MTHRRLFLYLLALGMILMVVSWTISYRTHYNFRFYPQVIDVSFDCTLGNGGWVLRWDPDVSSSPQMTFASTPAGTSFEYRVHPVTGFHHESLHYEDNPFDPGASTWFHEFGFPVWVPFLILIGMAFVLLRVLENRMNRCLPDLSKVESKEYVGKN